MTQFALALWAASLGAILIWVGVLLVNWGATRRLKLRLRHEREDRVQVRSAELRRDVYLQIAQELVKASDHLLSLPLRDAQAGPMHGLEAFFACSTQVQLVADTRTSQLMGQLAGVYAELALKAFTRARPIQDLNAAIAVRDGFYERSQAEVNRVLAAMARLNETVQESGQHFMALQKAFVHHQELASKHAAEREALWTQRHALHQAFVRDLLQDMKRVSEAQYPVMVALRQELGVEGNLDEFRWQMEAQWTRFDAQLDAALDSMGGHLPTEPDLRHAHSAAELSPASLVDAALQDRQQTDDQA